MGDVMSGKEEENKRLRAQISLERQMSADEKKVSNENWVNLRFSFKPLCRGSKSGREYGKLGRGHSSNHDDGANRTRNLSHYFFSKRTRILTIFPEKN